MSEQPQAKAPAPAPAPAPFVPDLKRPRARIPEWAWWVGLAVVAGGVFVGVAWYMKSTKAAPAGKAQSIITSSEIPDDFFKSAQRPPAPEEKPEQDKAEKADKEAEEKAKKVAAAAALTPAPPQRVTAKDLFTALPAPVAPPAPDPVEVFNEQRRSGGASKIARAGRVNEGGEWINSQEDGWDEEERTDASYPTDLSRVVTATRFIPALLVNAINSELAGKVVATIEENVYGGHGRNVLIAAGSQAVGRYKALAKPGDERIMVIWERIITPEGINIHIGNAELADAMGRSGITGDVDNRFMDRYGMALLVSSLSALTAYQIPVTNQGQQVVVQTYGSNIASLSNQILEKNINLKPKIDLPAGQRILISPQRDIWFKKPERREMLAVALDPASPTKQRGKKR